MPSSWLSYCNILVQCYHRGTRSVNAVTSKACVTVLLRVSGWGSGERGGEEARLLPELLC